MAARAVTPRARTLATPPGMGVRQGPAPLALAVYGALLFLTLGVAFVRGTSPITIDATDAWLGLAGWTSHATSLLGGAALALLTVRATRTFVRRWGWAKRLHGDLRPTVHGAGDVTLLVLGFASGASEELFFRGLLTPTIGLILSSVAFGALHQLRGRAGWIWAAWAGVMGLLFGALFLATGSLLGPMLAHVTINVMNLRFLRDTDVEPKKPRALGGLLGKA